MTKEELWQATLAEIELCISKATFITWFRNTSISAQKNGGIVISVPNGFSKEWLQNKFNKLILKTLRNISPDIKELSFIIKQKKQTAVKSQRPHRKSVTFPSLTDQLSFEQLNIDKETNLNPKYTFDNYIVGASNELAHAASSSVAQNPGKEYNPLFIYGGVGLGKTHLLQAVGNSIKEKRPQTKIQYLTCEKFTNDFINAIRAQKIKEFRENYRKVDLLVIDDVQFIARKERTQEEFFHTFNTLFENNKQVILSSDRPPKAINSIEERLRSRFQGGMIADIGYPDFEMRVAILRSKIKEKNVELPPDVVEYIAEHIQNNIRELEGTLNVLLASSKMGGVEITLENAKKHLNHIIKRPRRIISLKKILKTVADFYDITEKDLLSQNRKRDIARPRQIIMYLLREDLNYSYPLIGTKLGGRDHTTVIHACSKISQELKDNNEELAEELSLLKQGIYNS
ncbi:MAG: chromosomal replication initiator protein DnaA [Candidatus Spechtbacterales bacterium]